jgi:XTP/dITP diphosphohydrolase
LITLLIATGNPGKLREFEALLHDLPIHLTNVESMGLSLPIDETGETYAANASLKAEAYARASGLWTLADDSGLEVDALGGLPGPQSARLAGPQKGDEDRRAHLLRLLQPHPRPWTARFRCVVALAHPQAETDLAEGLCEGIIIPQERGTHGFGYDPIFQLAESEKTMAQLSMEEKNRLSHRARALHGLLPVMRKRLKIN